MWSASSSGARSRSSPQLENRLLDLAGPSRCKRHLRTDRAEARLLKDSERPGVVAGSTSSDRPNRDLLEQQAERPRCNPLPPAGAIYPVRDLGGSLRDVACDGADEPGIADDRPKRVL